MEVKPGYKHTDIGMIPEDWGVKTFAQLFAFRNGVNADKESYGQGIRFVNVLEPITYSHLYGPEIPGRVTLPEPVAASFAVRRGDVLFNRTSETQNEVGLAATYLGTDPVVFGGFVIRGRPTDQSLDPRYSGYALRAPAIRTQIVPMGQGAIRANIGQQNLSLVVAPVPPLVEQCSIAETLSDADALIQSLEQLLIKKRQIKQGAMQELLTGRKRLPGFSDEWHLKALRKVTQIPVTDGPHLTPRFLNDGVPFLSVNNLVGNTIDLSTLRFVSKEDHAEFSKKCRPQKDDVLLGKAASVGRVAIVDFDMEFNIWSPIALIRANSDNVPRFVYYSLQTEAVIRQIELLTNSSSQGNIGMRDIERLVLFLPTKGEQQAIADALSDIDGELAALEAKLSKARNIKQGMMQELLTGRIRLV